MFWRLTFLTLVLVMQSCYVTKTVYTENIFNSWISKSAQDLMLQQGSPARIVSDGKDGQVYVYDRSQVLTSTYSSPGQFYNQPVGAAVPGYQQTQLNYQPGAAVSNEILLQKKVEYFVDKDGFIYAWHSTGYPKTYKQRYKKEELENGSVNQGLFTPPVGTSN